MNVVGLFDGVTVQCMMCEIVSTIRVRGWLMAAGSSIYSMQTFFLKHTALTFVPRSHTAIHPPHTVHPTGFCHARTDVSRGQSHSCERAPLEPTGG